MPTKPFTEFWLRSLSCERNTRFYDSHLPCLGLRAGPYRKTWFVEHKRRRIPIGRYPYTTLAEARQKAHQIIGADALPEPPERSRSLTAILNDYYPYHASQTRPRTARAAKRILSKHIDAKHGALPIKAVTKAHITKIIQDLAPTPGEAMQTFLITNAFFNWCVRSDILF